LGDPLHVLACRTDVYASARTVVADLDGRAAVTLEEAASEVPPSRPPISMRVGQPGTNGVERIRRNPRFPLTSRDPLALVVSLPHVARVRQYDPERGVRPRLATCRGVPVSVDATRQTSDRRAREVQREHLLHHWRFNRMRSAVLLIAECPT